MKLSTLKSVLPSLEEVNFILPDGQQVPSHYHVTEVGEINRHFVDCGGTVRKESVINFQLFAATDFDHRVSASKLANIIAVSESKIQLQDLNIEVEYQGRTIEKFDLDFDGTNFILVAKKTACLDMDKCGIPEEKPRIRISTKISSENSCVPGSGCC